MAYLDETGLARFWYDIKQWIASAASNLVHRTGHEDITGRKVFNTSQYWDAESSHNILVSRPILRTLDFARGDAAPAEDKYVSLDMVDNTYDIDTPYLGTARLGGVDYIFRTSGERSLGFTLLNPQNAGIRLLLGYDASGVAFASAPSTSSQRNSGTDIVTRDWIPNDTRVVHTTGNEIIDGIKTFNQYVEVNREYTSFVALNPELTFGQNPSADKTNMLRFTDSVGNDYGSFASIYRQNGETLTRIVSEKSGGASAVLEVNNPATGASYASCPSTPDPTSANLNGRTFNQSGSTDILTRDWIPRDTRIVHTAGNEQISGDKSFESTINIRHSTAKGTDPSGSTSYRQLNFSDSTGTNVTGARASCVESVVSTGGQTSTYMRAYNWVAGSNVNAYVAVHYPKNGTAYTEAPTPSDVDDNSTKIATTAWAFPRLARFYDAAASAALDLNDFITPGVYTFSGYVGGSISNVVANIPEGVNGTLLVIGNSSYIVRQVWFRLGTNDSTDHRIFVRQRNWMESNSWSAWTRLFTSKDTIPVANGGTGQTSVANIQAGKDGDGNTISSTYLKLSGGTMSGVITRNGELCRSGNAAGAISIYNGSSASDGAGIWLYGKSHSTRPGWTLLQASDGTDYYSFAIEPSNKYARFSNKITSVVSDVSAALGSTSKRWGVLYTTGNVNVGSDERIKQQIEAVPDKVLDAWESVDWCQFKLNAEVESNGEYADLHTGLIAQKAGEALSSAGIDPLKYGFITHAEWGAVPEELDEEGNVVVPAQPAGDEYSICYAEALCIEAAYLRRENGRLKKRVSDLEGRLAALELRLGSA